jgi:outer membrane protein OmpA-like peptidoglycan-associated protein
MPLHFQLFISAGRNAMTIIQRLRAMLAVLLSATLASGTLFAQSAGDMANTLAGKPKVVTRGFSAGPKAPDPKASQESQFLNGLRTRGLARSITVEERAKVAEIAQTKPAIDLEVNFEYNSAFIGAKAAEDLTNLGAALRDPRLKGALVLVAGHTDGKGADAYNQDLSERRADAVKQFLVAKFSVPVENLVAVGYGKERLKNTANPLAGENRRVQVVNMSGQ